MTFALLLAAAQMMCWHVSAEGRWWNDTNCPEKHDDQGAAVYAEGGISLTMQGEYYFDDGWAMCLDGRPPVIVNARGPVNWETTIDCRGKGKDSRGLQYSDHGEMCPVEPKYEIHYRAGLWQVHVFCPAAVPVT